MEQNATERKTHKNYVRGVFLKKNQYYVLIDLCVYTLVT